jgi:hypothetical protein
VGEGDYRPSAPTAAGWYVDPGGNGGLRWWDGNSWTDDVADTPSVEAAPLPPPADGRPGDRPDGRPARHGKFRRSVFIGVGIVVAFAAGATVGGAIEHEGAQTPTTNGSTPNSATLQVEAGQVVPWLGKDLHDNDVVHIVATGLWPGMQYYVEECKSGTTNTGDCDFGSTDLLSADASGTVRIDYVARKGPFGDNNVTCSTPSSCEIAINQGLTNQGQYIIVFLDFT